MTNDPIKLVIIRTFDAPRQLVWRAWTDPEFLKQWSCPNNFVITLAEGELKVGGRWRSGMKSPEYGELFVGGVYQEIKEPERLVFTHIWEDKGYTPGVETLVTIELTEKDGKTTMVFTQSGFGSSDSRDSHNAGWSECFDKLEKVCAGNVEG